MESVVHHEHDLLIAQVATLATQVKQWLDSTPDEIAREWLVKAWHRLLLARAALGVALAIEHELESVIVAEWATGEVMG